MTDELNVRLEQFPDYTITREGLIFSDRYPEPLAVNYNQYGVGYVRIRDGSSNLPRVFPVARLMAMAFVEPPPTYSGFGVPNTIIFHDFDQQNWTPENLSWRPRWFALEYHAMPDTPAHLNPHCPSSESPLENRYVVEANSGMASPNGYVEFSKMFGLLPMQIVFDTTYNPSRSMYANTNRTANYGFNLMTWLQVKFEEYE